jgi:hypothetical protein
VNALSPANVNGCQYLTSPPTLSDLQTSVIQCDSAGKLLTTATVVPGGTQDVNLTKVGGGAVALGSTTSAASIPVVVATDQVAVAIKAASGTIASGAVASGAVASGAVASGAYASGSLAAGAGTDGWDSTQGLKADAKSTATDTTAITMMSVAKEISFMEQNPASRAVTNAGTFATQSAITAASGSIASGAVASGAIASGAIASGAIAANAYAAGSVPAGAVVSTISTISATVTRPNDSNPYTANDAFANSTTVPTVGGFTLTSACRVSGGAGIITDAVITASAGTAYQGEIWVFDQAVTAVNDNAAFTASDGEVQTIVGVIPFNTTDITAANSISYVNGLNIGYTCSGTANLRFLVKILNAPTPGASEVLSVRIKVDN